MSMDALLKQQAAEIAALQARIAEQRMRIEAFLADSL